MKFYIDITLLSDPETPLYFLWEKVYQQIHLALVETKNKDGQLLLGVSFPKYRNCNITHPLGDIIRIFSDDQIELEKLNIKEWLSRLSDYVNIGGISSVPENISSFACFKRERTKGNNERLARRKAKRAGISFEEALSLYENREITIKRLPFINIKSLSNNNRFSLRIECINKEEAKSGFFDSYGLSSTSTVPIF